MVKRDMFNRIKLLQRQGFSIKGISDELSLDRKTVRKYYQMSEKSYKIYISQLLNRSKVFDDFKDDILEVYEKNDNKKLNTVSVYDFLEEKHEELPATERSLRNYIDYLIITGKLVLNRTTRMYSKVEELPYGKQMQLDFGEYRTKSESKLYIFAAVLSASRFKYVIFQTQPFKTLDVIYHLLNCFDFFQGIPLELVIDQDKLMVVSENRGDIIYTKEFNYFIDEMGLKLFVCRKADPETKGKIENIIKYIKYNFLQTRDFNNIESANDSLRNWLIRRGNGKINQTTKQIPSNLIIEERKHLRPIINSIYRKDTLIGREYRDVSDKSCVSVNASQYSVPVKYKNREVEIYTTNNKLFIFDIITGKDIADHKLSLISGKKVTNREHFREGEKKASELKDKVQKLFSIEAWNAFVSHNFKSYPRYVRDQCIDAKRYFDNKEIDIDILDKSLRFCIENKTFTFSNLKDTYNFYKNENKKVFENKNILNLNVKKERVNVNKRDLKYYKSIILNKEMEVQLNEKL
ncbi:MAG: IS21 family transposase [Spirochaetes bacterium]|nr:IS21 family transposase [Spirochaetota bacterium]